MFVTLPLTFGVAMRTINNMNPIEAAILAGELAAHMDVLSTLDLHPRTSAAEIENHRREAVACVEQLHAHLLLSDAFGPVNS
jgi:hypothetical protein